MLRSIRYSTEGSWQYRLDPSHADKIGRLIFKYGTKRVAAKYGVQPGGIRRYRRKYLADFTPPGKWKCYKRVWFVYTDGRIWSKKTWKFLTPVPTREGYWTYGFEGRMIKVHRLMLTLFVRKPRKYEEGRHLDGDPANNRLTNLAWGTAQDNSDDKEVHGTKVLGEAKWSAKLSEDDVRKLRRMYNISGTAAIKKYARRRGMSYNSVWMAAKCRTWKHVS